jgi:hypothetical protein
MSVQLVGSPRPSRKMVLGMVPVLVVVLAAGLIVGEVMDDVPLVYAAGNHAPNTPCTFPDVTYKSALEVSHHTAPSYVGNPTVVEPDTGESWRFDVYWYPAGTTPGQVLMQAWADVDWNGSSWVLSNVDLSMAAGLITAINICQGATCNAGGGAVHSWDYKLIVNVVDPEPGGSNLDHVTDVTTDVDDGDTIEDPTETQGYCYEGTAVQPTSQSFGDTDYNADWGMAGRCPYNCGIDGASVTITYD